MTNINYHKHYKLLVVSYFKTNIKDYIKQLTMNAIGSKMVQFVAPEKTKFSENGF